MNNEEYSCCLDHETESKLSLFLFKNVKNAKELQEKARELKCCMIKPDLICDPFQVAVAVNKAVLSQISNSMTTRSVNSEILFNLSISKNISKSLSTFGLNDKLTSILVAIIEKENEDLTSDVLPLIDGERCSIRDIEQFSNLDLIQKTYKIEKYTDVSELTDTIVSKISTKDFISH